MNIKLDKTSVSRNSSDLYNQDGNIKEYVDDCINIAIKHGQFSHAKSLIEQYYNQLLQRSEISSDTSLTLHIGAHKTASTFLQNILFDNQDFLRELHIGYIPLKEVREKTAFYYTKIQQNIVNTLELWKKYSKKNRRIIFSEENILYQNLNGTVAYGHDLTRLRNYQFYLSYLFNIEIEKIIIVIRDYDVFFQSLFIENNRHNFHSLENFNKNSALNFSWKDLIELISEVFDQSKINVLFFEDIIKNKNIFFNEFMNAENISQLKIRNSYKHSSPNYKAYLEVEKLYQSNLNDYTKDYLRRCLLYPEVLKNALEKAPLINPSSSATKIFHAHKIYDIHTEKLTDNLLFTKEEVSYLRNKYQVDKQAIKDNLVPVIKR